jgi:hypothetical protein
MLVLVVIIMLFTTNGILFRSVLGWSPTTPLIPDKGHLVYAIMATTDA